jgi:hypothetical protein
VLLAAGLASWTPFLWDTLFDDGGGHIQSVVLGAVLVLAAVQLAAIGLIGDMIANQRTLALDTHERIRRLELAAGIPPSHYEPGAPSSS